MVTASDDRTTPPIWASLTKNNTLMLVMAFKHVVDASKANNSPTQKGGSFHPKINRRKPIMTREASPNGFRTYNMQVRSINSPAPHVPILALMFDRRNMSSTPPTTAVPW
mmetsp:Transcript_19524/g.45810  ORF Transcript_19524/g.45810 Transcript_19524/m.45810 type:complete len:110 (+) Transcript_19524:284-613(+)